MHINLFHPINRASADLRVQPKHSPHDHQRPGQTTSTHQPEPQDKVTLSREAIKALKIDYRAQANTPSPKDNDNKINSLERWVEKAVTKTETNNGRIPFGMEWKLEYLNSRITKALDTDIGPNGHILNLTEQQQEKLSRIKNIIRGLLSPPSNDEDVAKTRILVGESS
ncbi:hypothetical protein WH95_13285 [Kiloniella litopenaei]|uniref:Uncharacterized protein n=1 Tax=Kiloniella litopenaei TaxID=1549748 RepID=A0A0M2R7P5_9PROT|nr:hypothetical protein [Kiloniella litopenaei]KKJ76444.1 hypothetical protein WH95_13285 [Kiloniella litopenaei]